MREVTAAAGYEWDEPVWAGPTTAGARASPALPPERFHVVAYDFGIKRDILRQLRDIGLRVTSCPRRRRRATRWRMKPDGVFLSNGPGDPAAVDYAVEAARELTRAKLPVFGICLGHQILGLALGGKTYKLQVRPPRRQPPGHGPGHAARSRSRRRTTASPSTSIRCRGGRCCRTST